MEFVAHVHECDDDPELVGKSIACEITDISGHGLHVLTDVAMGTDTLLNIKISIGNSISSYGLRGEICWTKITDNRCHVGIRFKEDEGLDAWAADFGSL